MQNTEQACYAFSSQGVEESFSTFYVVGLFLFLAGYAVFCLSIPTAANHLSSLLLGFAVLFLSRKDWRYGAVTAAVGTIIYVLFSVEPRYSFVVSGEFERVTLGTMILLLAGLVAVDFRKQTSAEANAIRQRVALRKALILAIKLDQFTLQYQPIVNAAGCIVAREALLRWKHPAFATMSPAVFLPVVEEIGAMAELERWVVKTACADAVQWHEPLRVQVNISPQSVSKQMLEAVQYSLAESRLSPSRLVLEIVETSLLKDAEGTIRVMQDLRALGVSLALDDFGAGFASLQYLLRFPFDQIKLDRSFMQDLHLKPQTRIITRYVLAMAREMRLIVTAEGIETDEQRTWLIEQGVMQMQGYLFGRPVNHEQVCRERGLTLTPSEGQLKLDLLAVA